LGESAFYGKSMMWEECIVRYVVFMVKGRGKKGLEFEKGNYHHG